jgi:arsenate reductase
MKKPPYKVLILCTRNADRSVVAEYLLRAKGHGRFEVFSAGTTPAGRVDPLAVQVLREHYGLDASAARSKSWEEYKDVHFDFVVTVCDDAREACPDWPGQPIVGHWGSPDPAAVDGTEDEKEFFFVNVTSQIASRVDLFCAFPDDKLTPLAVHGVGEQFKMAGEPGMAR